MYISVDDGQWNKVSIWERGLRKDMVTRISWMLGPESLHLNNQKFAVA